jgi:tetratricopeptide (TPR) repeat protein
MSGTPRTNVSPWRAIFEAVRDAVGARRDEHGVLGSINWLRRQMEARGANPNVVRNIIYRDKGKLSDKRVLFEILRELWATASDEPLRAPEIEVLLSPHASAEQEVLQLLGREKRRAFRSFVRAVREGEHPKLLVTGRPGSGKTMLTDYIQQALQVPPAAEARIVRMEFGAGDLGTALGRLGEALDVPREAMEARLAKIGTGGAFAVQADAQADVARAVLDALRTDLPPVVLLLHVSQALSQQQTLGSVPLRLNTPDVPRVGAPEWLWATLLEPLSRLPGTSVLASMTDLPARAMQRPGAFGAPVKLTPPTAGEARRFVKARLPHLPAGQQEEIVQRAGRSFEELRTLTLLAEIRAPLPEDDASAASIARLGDLVVGGGDPRLRDFLAALATVSLPEFPTFRLDDLTALRPDDQGPPSELERAFVDPVPGDEGEVRCFSRRLVRALRERLAHDEPERHRRLHAAAAERLRAEADAAPGGEAAARHVHHLYEARDWEALIAWMRQHGIPQSLVRRAWQSAREELEGPDPDAFERLAEQVAGHYVKLGSYRHPDALDAFELLTTSSDDRRRAWAVLKQAEGAVLRGHHDEARHRLAHWPGSDDPLLAAEAALVRASIVRWTGELSEAARIVEQEARPLIGTLSGGDAAQRLGRAKVAVWAGLIHKDRGDLEAAAREFASVEAADDLVRARLAFQSGDVLMSLGRYGAAAQHFDDAVRLSHRSGALGSERTRYLARRATLLLRRGELAAAEADIAAAHAILSETEGDDEIELGFWRARVDDEGGLLLMARGRHEDAISLMATTVERYRAYGDAHGVDAAYRIDRATLRLGVAYAARGLGIAWLPPYPHVPDGPVPDPDRRHALELLGRVASRVPPGQEEAQAPDALVRRALLVASLLDAPATAVELTDRAARLAHFPYLRADVAAHRAAALLRGGHVAPARDALEHAWSDLRAVADPVGDPGTRAWLHALTVRTHVAEDDPAAAGEALEHLLSDDLPDAMRTGALRAFGEALEAHDRVAWLERPSLPAPLRGAPGASLLRPGDLLVGRWRARGDGDAVPVESLA